MSEELEIGRAAKAAGITREQARKAIAAISGPTGGVHYTKRMAVMREVLEGLGENVWRMSDATLEKRLARYPRVKAIIQHAKDADATAPQHTDQG